MKISRDAKFARDSNHELCGALVHIVWIILTVLSMLVAGVAALGAFDAALPEPVRYEFLKIFSCAMVCVVLFGSMTIR
jgi:hypothetical protein